MLQVYSEHATHLTANRVALESTKMDLEKANAVNQEQDELHLSRLQEAKAEMDRLHVERRRIEAETLNLHTMQSNASNQQQQAAIRIKQAVDAEAVAKAAHDNLIAEQDMLRIAQKEQKEMEKKLELHIAVARQTELAAKQEADRLAYEREAAQQAQLVADRVTHEQTESYEKPQLSPDEAQFTLGTARMLPQAKFSDMVASHEAPKMAAINNDSKNTPCSAEETSDRFVFGRFVYQKKHPLDIDDDDRKEESKRYAKRPLIDNQTAKMQTIAKQLQKPDLHPASRNRLHADLFALLGGRSSIPMLDEDGNIVDETNNEEQEHSDHVHGMIKGMMSGESSEELS